MSTFPDVAVMYADLTLLRVPWAKRTTLPTNNVLSISIAHPGGKEQRKRRQAVCEFDRYLLAWTIDSCYLGGYNDDYYWFSLHTPELPYGKGFIHTFPYVQPKNSILFEGIFVDKDIYAEAKKIFLDQGGGMF